MNIKLLLLLDAIIVRNYSIYYRFVQDSRSGASTAGRGQSHAARRKGLRETVMAPAGGTAMSMGQGALAGASALGLGALAFYGLGLSNEMGTVDKAVLWPQEVKNRIRYVIFNPLTS